jgi:hypothetical protein
LTKRGCNSFTPETGVLMADGSTQPISQVQVGDLVAARNPETGELTAQPVLNVIVGYGDKHLIGVTTSRAPPTSEEGDSAVTGDDTWVATANHPIWMIGAGWTDAANLRAGDLTLGVNSERRVVSSVLDYGWQPGQTVFNLSVANTHTYIVGNIGGGALVHNSSCSAGGLIMKARSAVQHNRWIGASSRKFGNYSIGDIAKPGGAWNRKGLRGGMRIGWDVKMYNGRARPNFRIYIPKLRINRGHIPLFRGGWM